MTTRTALHLTPFAAVAIVATGFATVVAADAVLAAAAILFGGLVYIAANADRGVAQ